MAQAGRIATFSRLQYFHNSLQLFYSFLPVCNTQNRFSPSKRRANEIEALKFMAKLLIIEDEPLMVSGLRDNFEYEGYEVITAQDGSEGLKRALSEVPDLILLDVMLPKISGFDVCLNLKAKHPSILIIMLTARFQVSDRVVGLELGADDYVTKPFSISELSARVKALLRRVRSDPKHTQTDGPLCQPKSDTYIPDARAQTNPLLNRFRSFRSLVGNRSDRIELSGGRNNI